MSSLINNRLGIPDRFTLLCTVIYAVIQHNHQNFKMSINSIYRKHLFVADNLSAIACLKINCLNDVHEYDALVCTVYRVAQQGQLDRSIWHPRGRTAVG